MKLEFLWQIFEKKAQISSLIKIRSVGAELFYAIRQTDGHTDITKLIVTFRNFTIAPKNVQKPLICTSSYTGIYTCHT